MPFLARLIASTKPPPSFVPHSPTDPQWAFLALACLEALYGGAAGGGKSDALLMAALQYVDVPGYAAILFRRTYADLALPGALMDRAGEWLAGTGAHWNGQDKLWTFPSGATLSFGYLANEADKYRYQSAEFQFIGFDELTQFAETQYRYLFSRLRRLKGSAVPLRMRSASNPGGEGHDWVYARFFKAPEERVFIPAKLEDNPHIDALEYERSLAELDIVTRAQLRHGDWRVRPEGGILRRAWWMRWGQGEAPKLLTADQKDAWLAGEPPMVIHRLHSWDTAFSEKTSADFSAMTDWGVFLDRHDAAHSILLGAKKDRWSFPDLVRTARDLAKRDQPDTIIVEAKASGLPLIQELNRQDVIALGYNPGSNDKITRANAVAPIMEGGRVWAPLRPWADDVIAEVAAFPIGPDDWTDTVTQALLRLRGGSWVHHPDDPEEVPEKPRTKPYY